MQVGKLAFYNCTKLSRVSFPGGSTIKHDTFTDCVSMETISNAPEGIKLVYNHDALEFKLKEISFAGGVEEISGLSGLPALTKVTLPEGVKIIDLFAFENCKSLNSINLPSSITEIGNYAFTNCRNLHMHVTHKGNSLQSQYKGSGITGITWQLKEESHLDLDAFNGCRNLTSINLSGKGFYSTDGIQYFKNSDGQSELVRYPAGKNRGGSFRVPEDVDYIYEHAFESCALTDIYLPTIVDFYHESSYYNEATENYEERGPFDAADAKANIYFVPNYTGDKIDKSYGYEGYALINGNRVSHEWKLYPSPKTGVTFKYSGVTFKVKTAAGSNVGTVTAVAPANKNITTLKIPEYVNYNGYEQRVDAIGKNAFKGCKKLKTVVVGNKVKSIGNSAFSGCGKLSKVTLGTGVKTLGSKVFYKNKGLKNIIIKSKVLKRVGKSTFKGIYKKAKIKVPSKKLKTYKKLFKKKGQGKKVKISK